MKQNNRNARKKTVHAFKNSNAPFLTFITILNSKLFILIVSTTTTWASDGGHAIFAYKMHVYLNTTNEKPKKKSSLQKNYTFNEK